MQKEQKLRRLTIFYRIIKQIKYLNVATQKLKRGITTTCRSLQWQRFFFTYQEGITAVTTDHSHPLRLDGQRRLGGLLLWDHHHRAQVDDASAVEGAKRSLWFQRG